MYFAAIRAQNNNSSWKCFPICPLMPTSKGIFTLRVVRLKQNQNVSGRALLLTTTLTMTIHAEVVLTYFLENRRRRDGVRDGLVGVAGPCGRHIKAIDRRGGGRVVEHCLH